MDKWKRVITGYHMGYHGRSELKKAYLGNRHNIKGSLEKSKCGTPQKANYITWFVYHSVCPKYADRIGEGQVTGTLYVCSRSFA